MTLVRQITIGENQVDYLKECDIIITDNTLI